MRIRTIKPDFFRHEGLAELPFEARLCFQGLWCLADSEGRLEDRPKRIKADIFPYDDLNIETLLTALHEHGFIVRYEVENHRYICIPSWGKHQRLSGKEANAPSTIPALPVKQPGSIGEAPGTENSLPASNGNNKNNLDVGKQRGSNGEATGKIRERLDAQEWSIGKEGNGVVEERASAPPTTTHPTPLPAESPPDTSDPLSHPAVLAYNRALKPDRALTIGQCEQIAAAVADMAVWNEVLMIFQGNAYQARHAWNAIDRYQKEVEKRKSEKRLSSVNETPEQKQARLAKIVEQRRTA